MFLKNKINSLTGLKFNEYFSTFSEELKSIENIIEKNLADSLLAFENSINEIQKIFIALCNTIIQEGKSKANNFLKIIKGTISKKDRNLINLHNQHLLDQAYRVKSIKELLEIAKEPNESTLAYLINKINEKQEKFKIEGNLLTMEADLNKFLKAVTNHQYFNDGFFNCFRKSIFDNIENPWKNDEILKFNLNLENFDLDENILNDSKIHRLSNKDEKGKLIKNDLRLNFLKSMDTLSKNPIICIEIYKDLIITSSTEKKIFIYMMNKSFFLFPLSEINLDGLCMSMKMINEDLLIAQGTDLIRYNINEGKNPVLLNKLTVHEKLIRFIEIDDQKKLIYSYGHDKKLNITSLDHFSQIHSRAVDDSRILLLQKRTGNLILGRTDGILMIYRYSKEENIDEIILNYKISTTKLTALALVDEKIISVADFSGFCSLVNISDAKNPFIQSKFKISNAPIQWSLVVSGDSLVFVNWNGYISLWNLNGKNLGNAQTNIKNDREKHGNFEGCQFFNFNGQNLILISGNNERKISVIEMKLMD